MTAIKKLFPPEALPYESTEYPHVFKDVPTGKFYWCDECESPSEPKYETAALARQAMHDYIVFSMDGPDNLNQIEKILDDMPHLEEFTCVRVAKRAFAECRGEEALLALRAEVDKFTSIAPRLHSLVLNKPPELRTI